MSEQGKHNKFYKNVIWQYILQGVKYLLPLLVFPYLTRVLEPSGYAVYGYVASLMAFVQTFVEYGFNLSATKQIVKAESKEECNRIVGRVLQTRFILCIISTAVTTVLILSIPILRDNPVYTYLALLATFGRAISPDFVFQGFEDMRPITVRYLLSKGASTALTFVFVHSASDLLWVPILDIIASAIALVWSFASMKRLFSVSIRRVRFSECLGEFKLSGLYCFSNMASIVFSSFTTLLIGIVLTSDQDIAYWSVAISVIGAVQSLYSPIINSLYPHMVVNGDFRFARKVALCALPAIAVGVVLFAILSPQLMALVGGASYRDGSYLLVCLSPVLVFSFYSMLFGWPILGAAGRVKEVTATTVGTSIFCIVVLLTVSACGFASLISFCIVRCLTEMVLSGSRLACIVLLRKRGSDSRHAARN